MITDSAALVLFAIRSVVKLSQQIRTAYVDATRRRELTLPLPNFYAKTDSTDAAEFFSTDGLGKRFIDGYERDGQFIPGDPAIQPLLDKFLKRTITDSERNQLIDLHIKYRNVARAEVGGWSWAGDSGSTDPDDVYALLTVQQWQKGTDPFPSTLHRIAGTLVPQQA